MNKKMNKKQIGISIGLGLVLVPLVIYRKNILKGINKASSKRRFPRRQFRGLFK